MTQTRAARLLAHAPRTAPAWGYVALGALETGLCASGRPSARRWRRLSKTLLMPTLAAATRSAAAGSAAAGSTTALRPTPILTAQALSWVGDVALLSDRRQAFLGGLTAFLAAHAAYVAAFTGARASSGDRQTGRAAVGATVVVAVGAVPALALAAERRTAGLGVPVTVYAAALCAMVGTSARLHPCLPSQTRRLVATGASLFLASDTLLGVRAFVLPANAPTPRMDAAVMATYALAQGLIAAGATRPAS